MSTTETVLNVNETNNAISTEPVNKALDGQNVILAADRDNPLEVRDVSVNKEGKEETKRQVNMEFRKKSEGVDLCRTRKRARSDEHLEIKHRWKVKRLQTTTGMHKKICSRPNIIAVKRVNLSN